MATEQDAAFGRLAVERGLANADALRSLYARLPPGRSLAMEAVAQRLIAPSVAQGLLAELGTPPEVTAPVAQPATESGLPKPGTVLGERYQVRAILGQGGMGAVYAAWDSRRGEEVAVKVLLQTGAGTDLALARFEREAQAMAKVDQHAGIVRVRDYGRTQTTTYAVLDLVKGRDLGAIIREEGALPIERALALTQTVARAIQHCHEQGILHRDLKPANVLVREADGAAFVTDFGVALDQEAERLTKTGDLIGTPAYMSPEQADGDKAAVDARSDVYALGAILYALVAGRPPFEGSGMGVLRQVFNARPQPLWVHRPDTPKDVDVVCQKALSKDRRARYPTAAAFADELQRLRHGEPIEARPPSSSELFRWRLGRREPRAMLTVLAPLLLFLSLGAYAVVRRIDAESGDSSPAERLASHLDRLDDLLANDDPLGLEGDSGAAMDRLAGALHTACAELAGEAAATDEAVAALADRVERLERAEPRDAALADLVDDPERRALLRTFVRRAAFCNGLGYRGGLPELDTKADTASGEDLLMNALRLLRWREKGSAPYEERSLERARALLGEARQRGPENVAGAAGVVLAELDAVLALALRQRTVFERCVEAVEGTHAPPTSDLEPSEIRAQLQSNLGAFLMTSLVDAKQSMLVPLLEKNVLFVGDDTRDWTSPRGYRRLRNLLLVVDQIQEAPPAVELKAVDRLAVQVVAKISVHAKAHAKGATLEEWARLLKVVPGHLWSADEVRAEVYDTAIYAIEEALSRPRRPPLQLLLVMPRLGISPGTSYLKGQIETLLKSRALEIYLTEPALPGEIRRTGDAYFVWAVALQSTLEQGDMTKVENAQTLADLFAKSLGDDLPAERRERLGLSAKAYVELERPLTPFWRGYVRWRLVHHLVTLLGARPEAEQPAAAWKALLDEHRQLLSARDSFTGERGFMGIDRWIVSAYELGFVSRSYADALERSGDPSDTQRMPLQEEALAALEEVEPWAWKLVELTADGSDAAMQELGVKKGSLFGTAGLLDLKRNLNRILIRGIRDQTYALRVLGRYADALDLCKTTEERLEKSRLRPPLGFHIDWVWTLKDSGDAVGAEAKIREAIETAKDRLGTQERKDFLDEFDEGHRILATLRLEAGDREGARASLEAARAEGLGLHDDWRPVLEALGEGQ